MHIYNYKYIQEYVGFLKLMKENVPTMENEKKKHKKEKEKKRRKKIEETLQFKIFKIESNKILRRDDVNIEGFLNYLSFLRDIS